MSTIRPFAALRPLPSNVERVSAVPYDVVNAEEARAMAAGNPLSFLHVSRAEIDLPPATDPYSDVVYAQALGNFTAFYFYSYFLMQVPTGILADHWGPRKLLTAGSLVAACGTLLFASASSLPPANLGRLLIGGAAGVGYVALLTLATHWFPARFFATISGLTLFCGVAGAVSAGPPLRYLVESFGWRPVMFAAAAALMVLGAAIWRIVTPSP